MPRVTRAEAAAVTRGRLLDAAAEVFAEKGFSGASLGEIAERAGRTKGAVYGNFASKDELVLALLDRQHSAAFDELRARLAKVAKADDLSEALQASPWMSIKRDRMAFLLVWEFRLYALRHPDVAKQLAAHERVAHAVIREQIKATVTRLGIDLPMSEDRLATIVQCLIAGIELFIHLDPDGYPEGAMVDAVQVVLSATQQR